MWQKALGQIVKRRFQVLGLLGSVGALLTLKGIVSQEDLERVAVIFLTLCALIDPSTSATKEGSSN